MLSVKLVVSRKMKQRLPISSIILYPLLLDTTRCYPAKSDLVATKAIGNEEALLSKLISLSHSERPLKLYRELIL